MGFTLDNKCNLDEFVGDTESCVYHGDKEAIRSLITGEFTTDDIYVKGDWLYPAGEFTESPFGEHEESAEEICEKKGFETEYRAWRKENLGTGEMRLYRDFLAQVKGYCLIHNPSGTGGYIVTNIRELTKKQREFLFDYFMDMGDRFKAEQFWEE